MTRPLTGKWLARSGWIRRDDTAVVAGIRYEQQDQVGAIVASLQQHASCDRLSVPQPGLGVGYDPPVCAGKLDVPRSLVTGEPDRNLRAPPDLR
jgi:hypothetical protein